MRNYIKSAKDLTQFELVCHGVSKGIFALETLTILDYISVKGALTF